MEVNKNRDYKFKVGDKVRLKLSNNKYYSRIGVIDNVYAKVYEVKFGDDCNAHVDFIKKDDLSIELVESCEKPADIWENISNKIDDSQLSLPNAVNKETKKPITKPLLEFKVDLTPFDRFKKQLQDMVHKYDIANRLDKPIKIVIPQKPQVDCININMTPFPSNTKFKILSDFFIYDGWHESTNIKGVTTDYVDSKANNKVTLDYMGKQFDFDLEVYNYELINEPSKAKEYKEEFYDRQEYEDFDGIILQDKDKKYWF